MQLLVLFFQLIDLPNFSLQEQSGNKAQEEKGETGREKENIMSSLEGDAVV